MAWFCLSGAAPDSPVRSPRWLPRLWSICPLLESSISTGLLRSKDAGYRVIGLAAEGDVTLTDVDLDGPIVLVTGSEDQGLSLLTRRHCDQLVRIPLRGMTPSLNASVATALCVYEVARRSWMKDIHGQAPPPPVVRPHGPRTPVQRGGRRLRRNGSI